MSLNVNLEQITQHWTRLRQQWGTTKAVWNDSVRVRFEQEYWQPLENEMPQFLNSLQELNKVITQAKQNIH